MGKDFRRVVRRVIRRLQMLPQFLAEIPQGLRGMESRLGEMRTELDELNVSIKSTDRKMLYAAVGQALSAWGKMEEHLVAIAALLLRASTEKSGLILYSIINFNVWLTLIGDLYEMDGALSPFQKRWNRISQRIREIKDKRDQLAHHSVQMGADRTSLQRIPHGWPRQNLMCEKKRDFNNP